MPDKSSASSESPRKTRNLRRDLAIALAIFVLAVFARLPYLNQSLWCDELTTLKNYVYVPVKQIVAGGHGAVYYPNNHILFSLTAKISLSIAKAMHFIPRPRPTTNPLPAAPIGSGVESFTEIALRMPAVIAGSLVGIVLAWPLRRRQPVAALFLAIVLALHPWMISYSTSARGYTLLLVLVILATHLLPRRQRRIAWGYAVTVALALYTVPICATVIAAQGAVMLLIRRNLFWTWLRSALVGTVVAAVLYAPLFSLMRAYYRAKNEPTIRYAQFLQELPPHLFSGYNDPNAIALIIPLAVLLAGSYLAWKHKLLRPALLTFAIASVLGVFAPLISRTAGEVRFVPWLLLVYAIAFTGILMALWQRPQLRRVSVALLALLLLQTGVYYRHRGKIPEQPIRDGFDLLGKMAPPNARVFVVGIGSQDASYGYGNMMPQPLESVNGLADWQKREQNAQGPIWVGMIFEELTIRYHPEEWDYLQAHYTLRQSLPGRSSKFDIYERTQ